MMCYILSLTWQKAAETEVEHDVVDGWQVEVISVRKERRRQLGRHDETPRSHCTALLQ